MIYFTSDWHFNHNREFIYKKRGFSSIEEMNNEIVKRHNSVVRESDIVYCLGDCCLGGSSEGMLQENKKLIESLNGKLIIISGNHDTKRRIEMYKTCKNVIRCGNYAEMLHHKRCHFYLSHYPALTAYSGACLDRPLEELTLSLGGHTHSIEALNVTEPCTYNVGVDAHDCYPVSINKIIKDMKAHMTYLDVVIDKFMSYGLSNVIIDEFI